MKSTKTEDGRRTTDEGPLRATNGSFARRTFVLRPSSFVLRPPSSILRHYALWLGLALALTAILLGAVLGFAGPLITVGGLAALAVGLWSLTSLEVGLWGVIAVITLLPFGALPFKVVFTPTFLDLALLSVVLVYVFQWMTGRRRRLTLTPAHPVIAAFLALAVFSFVAGLPNGPLTSNLLRQFAELLLSLIFTFIVVDYLDDREKLERTVRIILICGVAAAALGILLYYLPESLSTRALSALRVFGYPDGDVLRYVENNPENPQRAISTSADPNVLGGLLAMIGGLLAPQLLAPAEKSVFGARGWAYLAFGIVFVCLLLTFSRGAMAALAVALLGLVLVRYRRLLWIVLLAALVLALGVAFVPVARDYVAHFAEGLQGQDLATQMRFGEYKDALILINRYPWLGVGFAGTPEIDTYLGVSSAYLIMTEEMGIVGLGVFCLALLTVFGWGYLQRRRVWGDEKLAPLWLGAHAGLAAALTVGLVDHYFFKLDFQPAGTIFWIFVGLCLAATRLAEERPHPEGYLRLREAEAGRKQFMIRET
jgi:O-antigen ligase